MESVRFTPKRQRKRGKPIGFFLVCLAIACIVPIGYLWYWNNYGPVDTRIEPDYGAEKPIFYQGEWLNGGTLGEGDGLQLPLEAIRHAIDPNIFYEESSHSIIMTTEHQVVRLVTEQLTAWVNKEPIELRFPAETADDGTVYVPIEPLKQLYGLEVTEAQETGIVSLRKPGDVVAWGVVPEASEAEADPVPVRAGPGIRSPIVGDLFPGDRVALWGEEDNWHYVQLSNGRVGYVDETKLRWDGADVYEPVYDVKRSPYVPAKPMGERVVLAWEQVYTKNPNPANFSAMPALNVVSPTWFHLLDGEGALENRADSAYVRWAHEQGYQVWALFSNSFDPDLTWEALSTFERRMNMVRQLLSWAEVYDLDGFNIDFENMHLKDGPLLTQFVRELTPLMHEAGLTVSIDVTFISTSENWSMFYDRKALGQIVDYMMVMAYDEHWGSSPVAGSVASLPWVERNLRRMIDESQVPPSKIVLGVPFYTRVWTEAQVDGKTKVTSSALGMDTIRKLVSERGLVPTYDAAAGQNYVEYKEDGAVKKIWIEDETSMKARIELVHEYGLGGIASWSRNFGNEGIWRTIDAALNAP